MDINPWDIIGWMILGTFVFYLGTFIILFVVCLAARFFLWLASFPARLGKWFGDRTRRKFETCGKEWSPGHVCELEKGHDLKGGHSGVATLPGGGEYKLRWSDEQRKTHAT